MLGHEGDVAVSVCIFWNQFVLGDRGTASSHGPTPSTGQSELVMFGTARS